MFGEVLELETTLEPILAFLTVGNRLQKFQVSPCHITEHG